MGRFLQGIGIAAPAILSFVIISDLYPLKKQQSLFAVLNGIYNLSVGAAPVLGSYVSLYFHWQGNFITLLGLGVVVFLLTLFFVPSRTSSQEPEKQDASYKEILTSNSLLLLISHMVILSLPYWIFVGMSPLLYMEDLGVTLSQFGFYQGSLASLFAIGTLLSGIIVNRFSHKKMLIYSNCILVFGLICLLFTTYTNSRSPLLITASMLPTIVGQIIPVTLLYPLIVNFLPKAKARISALLQVGRLISCALSLQLMGYLYSGSFQSIGLMISIFATLTIVTLWLVLTNIKLTSVTKNS